MNTYESSGLPTPVPALTPDNRQFWHETTEGTLLGRYCDSCQSWSWPPTRDFCPHCHIPGSELRALSGRGTVYSYTLVHRAQEPYADSVPYLLAYVLLHEGVTVLSNLIGFDANHVEIGAEVLVVLEPAGTEAALPRFAPAES